MSQQKYQKQSFLKWAYDQSQPAHSKYQTWTHQIYVTFSGIIICLISCYFGVKYIIPTGPQAQQIYWKIQPGSQYVGIFLIFYLIFMMLTKIHDYTQVSLYQALWACNLCLLMVAISMIVGCSAVIRASMIVITSDQIPWYADITGFLLMRKFPVGVAKYLTWPETTKLRIASTLHHLWFLPLSMWAVTPSAPGFTFEVFCLSAVLVVTMGALGRFSTPKYIIIKQETKDHPIQQMYFNMNGAWQFWKDVKISMFDYLYQTMPHIMVIIILGFCWNTVNLIGYFILKQKLQLKMQTDYKMFTVNRQIFPRDKNAPTGLICKHLNRPNFPFNIEAYIENRPQNSMRVALAKASCIKCKHYEKNKISIKQKVNQLKSTFHQKKTIIDKLENIEIKISNKQ